MTPKVEQVGNEVVLTWEGVKYQMTLETAVGLARRLSQHHDGIGAVVVDGQRLTYGPETALVILNGLVDVLWG